MGYLDNKGLAHLWNNLKALMKNDVTINQGGNIIIPEGLGVGPYTIEFTEHDNADGDFVTTEQLNNGIESANQYTDSSITQAIQNTWNKAY